MKNKSLIIIITVSIALFLGLVFAVYQIALKNDNEFYSAGYVSVTDTDISDKVYFTGGTVYKKGYNNEIVFKNVDNVKSEVSKYSFVYYDNKAISYLNDGVLMALDELDSDYVPYYNIKSNYILAYENGHYVIKTTTKDISLDNFIGRISDTKYVVAGNNLKLKLGSSEEFINNYYFELNFVEGNQVKIDNDKINVKTVAEESYIYVGDDLIIDLNNRIIKYKGNLKMNLSEITIDSDTNIDILYDSGKYNEVDDGNGGEGQGGEGGNGAGNNKTYEPEKVVEYKNVPYVELISSNVSTSRIRLEYRVIDNFKLVTGNVTVRYMNLATKEVGEVYCNNYDVLCVFDAQNLVSNTKYLVSILTSYVRNGVVHNDFIMFQRTFQTSEIDLGLEKEYVSSNSIAYRVKMNADSNFNSAKLNLYDNSGNLVGTQTFENNHQDVIINFDNLKGNSSYTAKIEDLVIGNVTYKTNTFGSSMNKTLKYNPIKDAPILNAPSASSNKKDYTFTFDLGMTDDKDNAIKEVTYAIYDAQTNELVKTIKKENTTPFTFEAGEEFSPDKTYIYQSTIKINDNEKTVYQKTLVSNEFGLTNKTSPYAIFIKGEITANTLSGSFKIYDADNTIDINQAPYIEYTDSEGVKGLPKQLEYVDCGEEESATTKCVNVYLDELSSNNNYTINLFSYVDLKDDPENENYIEPGFTSVGIIQVKTSVADIVHTDWQLNEIELSDLQEKVFDIDLKFFIDPETTSELVVDNMSSFDMVLYEGADETEVLLKNVHIEDFVNIKEEYFDDYKNIDISAFGITLNDLITRHMVDGSKISQTYTIKLTNGKSGTDYVDFRPSSFTFDIDPKLLEITNNNATLNVNLIKNGEAGDDYIEGLKDDTNIILEIMPYFDNKSYVTSIDYVIYDLTDEEAEPYSFKRETELDSETAIPSELLSIYANDSDEFLKRGHKYQVTYTLSLDLNGDGNVDMIYPLSSDVTQPEPVRSKIIEIPKQTPKFMFIPWTSDSTSIMYKYDIEDVDNALGSNPVLYYSIGENEYTSEETTCPRNNASYNYAFKCANINGLSNNNKYTLFFKGNYLDDDEELTAFEVDEFKFESIMSETEINNKFNFELSSRFNNLAVISISDGTLDNHYLNRIANYNIKISLKNNPAKSFTINNVNDDNLYYNGTSLSFLSNNSITYTDGSITATFGASDEANLGTVAYVNYCDGISGEKCIFFDYAKLYNSKARINSSKTLGAAFQEFKGEELTIEIGFMYDTGKVGYYAQASKKYAFQVQSSKEVIVEDEDVNGRYYVLVTNFTVNGSHYNFGALGGVYSYSLTNNNRGFVADSAIDNDDKEYITKGREGQMTLINGVLNGQSMNLDYSLEASGVMVAINVNNNDYYHPIVAKELGSTTAMDPNDASKTYKVPFTYTRVSPTLGVSVEKPTINGLKLWVTAYGFAPEDVKEEGGKQYLYIEIYKNGENNPIQTVRINNDETTSQTGRVLNNKFTLANYGGNGYADYKYDIVRVEVNGSAVTDYAYDYLTGTITFNDSAEVANNSIIVVSYNVVVYGLDINTSYYYKAYMNLVGNNDATYLIDSSSKTYEEVKNNFRTLSIDDRSVTINDAAFEVDSTEDYSARYLVPNFNIGDTSGSDIIGYEDFIYEVKYNDELLTINPTNACKQRMTNYYATLNNSCVTKGLYYSNYTYLDITNGNVMKNGEDFKFVFGTEYDLVIKAKVLTTNGYVYETLYSGSVPVRKLAEPTVNVTKRSLFIGSENALRFVVTFEDNDRVLTGFNYIEPECRTISVDNGHFLAYLGKGGSRRRDSHLDTYLVENNGASEIVYTSDLDTRNLCLNEDLYSNSNGLEGGVDYYLILKYATDTNNLDSGDIKNQELRFPIYTLDDNKVALGKVVYFASNENGKGISELNFSYATNIREEPDMPDQEAYIAGMKYNVGLFGGDPLFEFDKNVFFVDVGDPNVDTTVINYIQNLHASSEQGENYYQILLNHIPYKEETDGANYDIWFSLYLGGNNINNAYDCTHTGGNPNSNYWDSNNNKCYIFSSKQYRYSTQFKAKGSNNSNESGGEQ